MRKKFQTKDFFQQVLEQQKQCLPTNSQVQPNPYKFFCKTRTCLQNLTAKRINPFCNSDAYPPSARDFSHGTLQVQTLNSTTQ